MRTGLRTLGAEPRSIIEAPDTLAHWQQNPGSEGRLSARLSRIHTARRCVAQERQIGTGERQMRAMILDAPRRPLRAADIPRPEPGPGQVLLAVAACGVCRTDLHVLDGELPNPKVPLILGHEIVGTVTATGGGPGVDRFGLGDRVGGPWLGRSCGECRYCHSGRENLCDRARFTGYQIDGGYAEYAVADARFCFPLPDQYADRDAFPLLFSGLISYLALVPSGFSKLFLILKFGVSHTTRGHISPSTLPSIMFMQL